MPRLALFDPIEDQQHLITATLRVLGCRVQVLSPGTAGIQGIADQLERDGPFDVVLWDLSPVLRGPCDDLQALWASGALAHSGLVITTTEMLMVEPMLGPLSAEAEVLPKPYTYTALMHAVGVAAATGARRELTAARAGDASAVLCRVPAVL